MKVAILTINIGKYTAFLEKFHLFNNKNFLPDCEKNYYIFTDSNRINLKGRNAETVNLCKCQNFGWPNNTLLKFNIFYNIVEELSKYDYVFFFNSNLLINKPIYKNDILDGSDYIFTKHPDYEDNNEYDLFPYDRNPHSTSFIMQGNKNATYYISNKLFGAKTSSFIEMCKYCSNNVSIDYSKNIIALRNDESHLNKFLTTIKEKDKCKFLSGKIWLQDLDKKRQTENGIGCLLSKNIFGGNEFMRQGMKLIDTQNIRFSDKSVIKEIFIKENNEIQLVKFNKYVCYAPYSDREGIVIEMKDFETKIIWEDAGLSVYKYDKSIGCYK